MLSPYFHRGQCIVLVGAHLGNWEWGVLAVHHYVQHRLIGIYKPLSNTKIDQYLNNSRSRGSTILYPMTQAGRALVRHSKEASAFMLIADQTPSDRPNAHWLHFFGQVTPFLHGPDKMARKTGYPVFFFHIQRVKRGYYETTFELLSEETAHQPEDKLTRQYVQRLEEAIIDHPGAWLWTHRRWKHPFLPGYHYLEKAPSNTKA